MAIGFFVMDIFENTMKIMSVQAIPIQFPVILVHFTQKNCYLFRDSILIEHFAKLDFLDKSIKNKALDK